MKRMRKRKGKKNANNYMVNDSKVNKIKKEI